MRKLIFFLLPALLFCACAEDKETDEDETSASQEVKLSVNTVNLKSNIKDIKYLIKTSESSVSSNAVSGDSNVGFNYGLNSSDQIKPIFDPYSVGYINDISTKNNENIYVGSFSVDQTQDSDSLGSLECLVIYEQTNSSKCIVQKQDAIKSVSASFYQSHALLLVGGNDGSKSLYEYDLDITFTEVTSFKLNNCSFESDCFNSDGTYSVNGDVVKSFNTGDVVSFLINKDDSTKEMVVFKKVGNDYQMKKDTVSSSSVIDISGDTFYLSNGNLRQGWNHTLYYDQSNNNRTISTESLLVSDSDGYFNFFYQDDFKEDGFEMPMIFYLQPKRKDLPASYPGYTLEKMTCCKIKNPISGQKDEVAPMGWKKVAGYKKYILAYGEVLSNYYDKQNTDIVIDKAIILIDGSLTLDGFNDSKLSEKIYLYDTVNTVSKERNIITDLSFDSITNIENYVNGFKLTGSLNSNNKEIFFNPYSNSIETPNSNDQQTFTIKQAL